jgi:hypothetical protein
MALLLESETQIWITTFVLISVIYPIVFVLLIVKADRPAPIEDFDALITKEQSS